MRKIALLTLATLFSAFAVKAQSDSTDNGTFTVTGYLDNYYFKNFNNPLSGQNWGSSGFERIFDANEGQIQIGLVQTKFGYSTKKSDFVADLTFGPNADLGNFGNYPSLNILAPNITSTAFAIKQAYWTYKATDKFSVTAGQFGTHIGYEVIDAPVNYNYSLSNLFGNGPFYHVGVKANYAFTDKVGLMLGVVNGWDSYLDNNRSKSIIGQLFISPIDGWNVYINYIGGNENAPTPAFGKLPGINAKDTVGSKKHMIDLTTGYQVTDKFYVGLNYAYGIATKIITSDPNDAANATESLPWGGAALYSNYAINDVFGIGVRAEYFDNTQAVQYLKNFNSPFGAGTNVTSITVTGNITLANGHILLKPEFRMDSFKKIKTGTAAGDDAAQQLMDSDGKFSKNSQSTLGMAAIYKF